MFRRLKKILPSALLLNIYKAYVQSNIDYQLFGLVLRRLTSIVWSEFGICLQEAYVIILNLFTRVVLI